MYRYVFLPTMHYHLFIFRLRRAYTIFFTIGWLELFLTMCNCEILSATIYSVSCFFEKIFKRSWIFFFTSHMNYLSLFSWTDKQLFYENILLGFSVFYWFNHVAFLWTIDKYRDSFMYLTVTFCDWFFCHILFRQTDNFFFKNLYSSG